MSHHWSGPDPWELSEAVGHRHLVITELAGLLDARRRTAARQDHRPPPAREQVDRRARGAIRCRAGCYPPMDGFHLSNAELDGPAAADQGRRRHLDAAGCCWSPAAGRGRRDVADARTSTGARSNSVPAGRRLPMPAGDHRGEPSLRCRTGVGGRARVARSAVLPRLPAAVRRARLIRRHVDVGGRYAGAAAAWVDDVT